MILKPTTFPRILAAAAVLTGPLACFAAPLPGTIHHWNFDEGPDWHDSPAGTAYSGTTVFNYGSSANATLQNMGAGNWVSGRQYTALSFNGSNQYVNTNTNLKDALGNSNSFSFWLRTTQTGGTAASASPGIAGTTAGGGIQPGWIDNTGRIACSVDNVLVARSANPINDNRWHHIVITRETSNGAVQIFVDGQLSASATGPAGARAASFSSLGRIEGAGYFQGRLDQVHIFNQVISAGTVSTLFNNHAPKSWAIDYEGRNTAAFTTPSVLVNSYIHDVERTPLAVASFTQPAHGSVTHNGDGSFNFTPVAGYVGSDSFSVVVEDNQGGYRRTTVNLKLNFEPAGGSYPTLTYNNFAALKSNGADISHNGFRVARGFDWNKDGKTDLLVGHNGAVWLYLNNGTPTAPSFGTASRVQAAGVNISGGAGIALADLTGDGVLDLIAAAPGNKLAIYRNTAAANATPVLVAATFAKDANNADLVLSDGRFDVGDWDGDGRPDIVTGTVSGDLNRYMNVGTAAAPKFAAATLLFNSSYNLCPRLFDLDQNGHRDLIWGINWGGVSYWRDAGTKPNDGSSLAILDSAGNPVRERDYTDGAVPDFADFNGDGRPDLLMGGHYYDKILIAYAAPKTPAQYIADIEAIYDANSGNLGAALSANNNALLEKVKAASRGLASIVRNGSLTAGESVYTALAAHTAKYPFLKYQQLDPSLYHHVPSIALQNWMTMAYAKADTLGHRTAVANVMGHSGLRGWWRLNEGSGSVAADANGNTALNGTLLNGPVWVAGATGNALEFNGTNQSVQLPALTGLNSDTVTLSGWIRRNGSQVNYAGIAFMRGSASGLNFYGTTHQLGYHWNAAGNTYNFASALTVPDNVWTFVGMVVEPTKATLYLQPAGGTMQSVVNNVAHSAVDFSAPLYLGQDSTGGRFFKGAMDEFRVHSRALNASELQQLATATLPAPWSAQDIGSVGVPGSHSQHAGSFAVTGSGNDIWDSADGFRFAYQALSGDGSITARLVSQDRRNGWDKAGVMIRESLSPGSAHVLMAFTPDNGFAHQYRGATGGGSTHVGNWSGSKPAWLRLTRTGNVIRAYSSADGVTWTQRGGDLTLAMAANIQIGLAVSSHDNGQAGTAVFDNVTVAP